MTRLFSCVVAFTLFWIPAFAVIDAEAFTEAYESHLTNPTPLSADLQAQARNFEWIFVGGFLGDLVLRHAGYFREFKTQLSYLGVPKAQLHDIHPPSRHSTAKNARNFIYPHLEMRVHPRRKLVIVAHSKGAAEVLKFALQHHNFIRANVQAVVLLSGANGGSEVADHFLDDHHSLYAAQTSGLQQVQLTTVARMTKTMGPLIHDGLVSITTYEADDLQRFAGHRPEGVEALSEKLLYVTGWQDSRELPFILRATGRLLELAGRDNSDGLVTATRQTVKEIPGATAVINGLHHAMPCDRLLQLGSSSSAVPVQRAFIRALVTVL